MGLDCTHDCWHGSYSIFSAFRAEIAKELHDLGYRVPKGLPIVIPPERIPNQGPPPDEVRTDDDEPYIIRWSETYNNSVWLGQWDSEPGDVIDVLMIHSDCEGIIPHRFCQPLAYRLSGLVPYLAPPWDERALDFVVGLMRAHHRGESVEFN